MVTCPRSPFFIFHHLYFHIMNYILKLFAFLPSEADAHYGPEAGKAKNILKILPAPPAP